MKIGEMSFRTMYHEVCYIENNESIKQCLEGAELPGDKYTGIIAYGYVDSEAGFSFEVLSKALADGTDFVIYGGNEKISIKLRKETVNDCEFIPIGDDGIEMFAERISLVDKFYGGETAMKDIRNMSFIDNCRNSDYPDDVQVVLSKEGYQLEIVWVTTTGLTETHIVGTLLNEPDQDFGIHEGDEIEFNITKATNGEYFCICKFKD